MAAAGLIVNWAVIHRIHLRGRVDNVAVSQALSAPDSRPTSLRKKPVMTAEHNQPARLLAFLLMSRFDRSRYTAGERAAVRISDGSYFVPDVTVSCANTSTSWAL